MAVKMVISVAITLASLFYIGFVFFPSGHREVAISEVVDDIEHGRVKSVDVVGDEILMTNTYGTPAVAHKEDGQTFAALLASYGVAPEKIRAANITVKSRTFSTTLLILIPFFIIALFVLHSIWQMQRVIGIIMTGAGRGGNHLVDEFRRSNARDAKGQKVTFKDAAGVEAARYELEGIVDFLRNPEKYRATGAKLPKGVLLTGLPGTGKTLLARAIAGEANVPFLHISGSEFVELFVGVGAARVRDLFDRARKKSPCIVFIDEIDAIGSRRTAADNGGERNQTLIQILVEMDGFGDTSCGVVVLAATNRFDVLDPALLRPGRFDRHVTINMPDIDEREAILRIHAANKPLEKSVDLRCVAEDTDDFSGADLACLLNQAAIIAARRNSRVITKKDVETAIEKRLASYDTVSGKSFASALGLSSHGFDPA